MHERWYHGGAVVLKTGWQQMSTWVGMVGRGPRTELRWICLGHDPFITRRGCQWSVCMLQPKPHACKWHPFSMRCSGSDATRLCSAPRNCPTFRSTLGSSLAPDTLF